jgi:hypothetical protein
MHALPLENCQESAVHTSINEEEEKSSDRNSSSAKNKVVAIPEDVL